MATTNRDTLNQIITELQTIAENHYQINSFSFGDIWEINTSGSINYPLMHLNIENVGVQGSMQSFRFNLLFCDIVKGGEVNETDVLNDQLEIAKDVIAQLKHPDYAWDFLGDSLTLEAFTERLTDSVSGYSMSINLDLPFDSNRCSIPTSNIVITAGGSASSGAGGTIYINVNGVLNQTIVSTDLDAETITIEP